MVARGMDTPATGDRESPAGAPLVARAGPARAAVWLRPPVGLDELPIRTVCRDMQRAAAGHANHDLQVFPGRPRRRVEEQRPQLGPSGLAVDLQEAELRAEWRCGRTRTRGRGHRR